MALAAAVLYRATESNAWVPPNPFDTYHVVEHLGGAYLGEPTARSDAGRPITALERAAIESALAPYTVNWVPSRESVIGDGPALTANEALVIVNEPVSDGARAEVGVELWCGGTCAVGSTLVLQRSQDGAWTVVEELEGFVS